MALSRPYALQSRVACHLAMPSFRSHLNAEATYLDSFRCVGSDARLSERLQYIEQTLGDSVTKHAQEFIGLFRTFMDAVFITPCAVVQWNKAGCLSVCLSVYLSNC